MLRFIEFFSGIGGFHASTLGRFQVVAAFDQDDTANKTYELNFSLTPSSRNLESITTAEIARLGQCAWFMSPPCQPFTQKGIGRDIQDPRCRPLLNLIDRMVEVRPQCVVLENVPPFAASRAHALLMTALHGLNMQVLEFEMCPTELGFPSRRKRYFLLAALQLTEKQLLPPVPMKSLIDFLDPNPDPTLLLEPSFEETFGKGVDIVDGSGLAACFGSSYGRVRCHSGSYLRTPEGIRRFSPFEMLRLLAFPANWRFPESFTTRQMYRLAGNSVHVECLRHVTSHLIDSETGDGNP